MLLSICFTIVLIAYSPLNSFLPGKSSEEVQNNLISLSLRSDSLEQIINRQDLYLNNIRAIITGDVLFLENDSSSLEKTVDVDQITFEKSLEDSLLRVAVEAENKGALYIQKRRGQDLLLFFSPVNGFISDHFSPSKKHYGIDVVAKEKTRISAVLDGTVVVNTWTAETGYVLMIQHKDDYLSIYKHNSILLKDVGDFVLAGEHVAVIGNSGELSSGPHLHFELWHKGVPVNPLDYISF
tara:strand:+ start:11 stop:727 length:717 start_codon:yes stop_codon:yes gene_type:complete